MSSVCELAEDEGDALYARAGIVGTERRFGYALRDTTLCRPKDRVVVPLAGYYVLKFSFRHGRRFAALHSPQERDYLRARARLVRAEGVLSRSYSGAVFDRSENGFVVIFVLPDVGERIVRTGRLGRSRGAPEEGDDLRAGT